MEWILEGWPTGDMLTQIVAKWSVSSRQASRYLAEARIGWHLTEKEKLEHQRELKIAALNKLKRTLGAEHKATPSGVRTILLIERELIMLQGLRPPDKVKLLNDEDDKPFKVETTVTPSEVDYSLLPTEVLDAILSARKKNHE